jgi:hypothetical protein
LHDARWLVLSLNDFFHHVSSSNEIAAHFLLLDSDGLPKMMWLSRPQYAHYLQPRSALNQAIAEVVFKPNPEIDGLATDMVQLGAAAMYIKNRAMSPSIIHAGWEAGPAPPPSAAQKALPKDNIGVESAFASLDHYRKRNNQFKTCHLSALVRIRRNEVPKALCAGLAAGGEAADTINRAMNYASNTKVKAAKDAMHKQKDQDIMTEKATAQEQVAQVSRAKQASVQACRPLMLNCQHESICFPSVAD